MQFFSNVSPYHVTVETQREHEATARDLFLKTNQKTSGSAFGAKFLYCVCDFSVPRDSWVMWLST